jgi:hypothetical protein
MSNNEMNVFIDVLACFSSSHTVMVLLNRVESFLTFHCFHRHHRSDTCHGHQQAAYHHRKKSRQVTIIHTIKCFISNIHNRRLFNPINIPRQSVDIAKAIICPNVSILVRLSCKVKHVRCLTYDIDF